MSAKTKVCLECDAVYTLSYELPDVPNKDIYCPFCGHVNVDDSGEDDEIEFDMPEIEEDEDC